MKRKFFHSRMLIQVDIQVLGGGVMVMGLYWFDSLLLACLCFFPLILLTDGMNTGIPFACVFVSFICCVNFFVFLFGVNQLGTDEILLVFKIQCLATTIFTCVNENDKSIQDHFLLCILVSLVILFTKGAFCSTGFALSKIDILF